MMQNRDEHAGQLEELRPATRGSAGREESGTDAQESAGAIGARCGCGRRCAARRTT